MLNLTKIFLDRPLVANLLTVLILIAGLMSLFSLKKSTYPEVNFDVYVITTVYPGASPEEVEVKVTNKIEDNILGIEGLDRVISFSSENYSSVIVWVDLNYKFPEKAKDEIYRAVDRVSDLPKEILRRPEIEEIGASNVPVIEMGITGDVSETELRKISKGLKENIKEINGVSTVSLIGYREKEVKIKADPQKLSGQWISLLDVISAIQMQNLNLPGGTYLENGLEKKIVTQSEIKNARHLKDVIIRSNDSGQRVRLSDVAIIEEGFEDHKVISRTEGKRSINLIVKSNSNGDVIKISQEINKIISNFKANQKSNIEIKVVRNFANYITSLLDIVTNNAYLGFFLVFVSLMIFLNKYVAFWTALGIPLSILGGIIFFPLLGININFIPLITMILVLGLIVDDAIVVAENIVRHKEMGKTIRQAAIDGAKEVTWPVITTIITTILAFAPIFFMSGVTGRFIQ
ncbi:MAG: hypothetical protein CME61_00940, partial [Halobacteriovoraceae bacterium]|nr:hypothetical protein [Halobacteriovoraceae bacterium]